MHRNISNILSLSEQLDFKIEQINGCRYFGPRRSHEKYTPPEGSEVFVGRLPLDCFEDELFLFFNKIGPVYDVRIMVTFVGETRGYGFVRYYNAETAKKAIDVLNSCCIRPGYRLAVTKSSNHRTLILFSLKYGISTSFSELEQVLKQKMVGLEKVEQVQSRQPLFLLHFTSHRAAAISKRNFTEEMLPRTWGWGSNARVYWQPNAEVQDRLKKKKDRKTVIRMKYDILQQDDTTLLANGERLPKQNLPSAFVSSTNKYQIVRPEQSNTEYWASSLTEDNSASIFGSKTSQPVAQTSYFQYNPIEVSGESKAKEDFYRPLTVPNTSYHQIPSAGQDVLQHWGHLPNENLPSAFALNTSNYQYVTPEQSNAQYWDFKENPLAWSSLASNVGNNHAPQLDNSIAMNWEYESKENLSFMQLEASSLSRANCAKTFDSNNTQQVAGTSYFQYNPAEECSISYVNEHYPSSPRPIKGTGEWLKPSKKLRF